MHWALCTWKVSLLADESHQPNLYKPLSFPCNREAWSHFKIGFSSVLRPRQHSIGYMGDGFYRSKDPTNSIKVLILKYLISRLELAQHIYTRGGSVIHQLYWCIAVCGSVSQCSTWHMTASGAAHWTSTWDRPQHRHVWGHVPLHMVNWSGQVSSTLISSMSLSSQAFTLVLC